MGDAKDGDGFQTGGEDDMRTELQNLQLQMDQTTDEVRSPSFITPMFEGVKTKKKLENVD